MSVCVWCGKYILSDTVWDWGGYGPFCSEKCVDEYGWEHGGLKEEAERDKERAAEQARRADADQRQREANQRAQQAAWEAQQRKTQSDKEHFRPSIEKRVGHPLRLDDITWNSRLETWVAKEEWNAEVDQCRYLLETASGINFSQLPGFDLNKSFWHTKFKNWGFVIPDNYAMVVYMCDGNLYNQSAKTKLASYGYGGSDLEGTYAVYDYCWAWPKDFVWYKAVMDWTGAAFEGINWKDYAVLYDGKTIVYLPDVREKLRIPASILKIYQDIAQDLVPGFANPQTAKRKGRFIYENDLVPAPTLFNKDRTIKVNNDVKLSAIQHIEADPSGLPAYVVDFSSFTLKSGGGAASQPAPAAKKKPAPVIEEDDDSDMYTQPSPNRAKVPLLMPDKDVAPAVSPLAQKAAQYFNAGDYKKAVAEYSKAIDEDSTVDDYYFKRAISYREMGKYKEAVADYDSLLDFEDDNAAYLRGRGRSYLGWGKLEEARADLEHSLELEPGNEIALKALEELEAKVKAAKTDKTPQTEKDGGKKPAPEKAAAKKEAPAVAASAEISGAIPDADFYIDPKIIYGFPTRKEKDAILADSKKFLALKPATAVDYCRRALAFIDAENYDKALADFNAALKLDAKCGLAWYDRSVLRFLMGSAIAQADGADAAAFTSAAAHFDAAIQDADALSKLCFTPWLVYMKVIAGNACGNALAAGTAAAKKKAVAYYQAAVDTCNEALEYFGPETPDTRLTLCNTGGQCAFQLGDSAAARFFFTEALKIDADDETALSYMKRMKG